MRTYDSDRPSGGLRLYRDLSWTWPIISPPEDYVSEAQEARSLVERHSRIPASTLLHLGCGGGHLDRSLKETFAITGVDTSEEMLALARRLNPEVEYVRGDLRTLDLGRSFDAVAVFDSIDYMLREADLRRAFETAWRHLRPGGVFLTYAERSLERFVPDRTRASTRSAGDVTITLIEHEWDPDPGDSTFETTFVYFIRRGKTLSIETDRHMMGLFPLASWWRTLQQVGFDVIQVESTEAEPGEPGVPWFVCVKPG